MKNEKLKNALVVVGLVVAVLVIIQFGLAFSNIGMAPTGGTPEEVERNFKNEPAQMQIDTIKRSPASPERKAQLIHDVEVRTGYKDKSGDVVSGGMESGPANAPEVPGK